MKKYLRKVKHYNIHLDNNIINVKYYGPNYYDSNVVQVQVSRLQLAEISAKCERYIGTAGGGMDQAIAVNAKQGITGEMKT